jgi:SAM-dependent methyltransferase
MKVIFLLLVSFSLGAESDAEQAFTKIYESWPWDDTGFSMSGSQIEITGEYVEFLQDFIRKNNIHSVVDIGCGDWAFSRYIDWNGIQYTGVDIVKFVIERNQKLFAGPSITFIYGDARSMELPEADLLVCKDVFQHLSNADIMLILKQQQKFKHCLFTNFVNPTTLTINNCDISAGEFHYVDLATPPFTQKGRQVLIFTAIAPKQIFYIIHPD